MDRTEHPANNEHPAAGGLRADTHEIGPTSDIQPQGHCSFLDILSSELRNRIYEEVLIEAAPIDITDALRPPALLAVNRQVRSETHRMWHKQNDFNIVVWACDVRLLLKWRARTIQCAPEAVHDLIVQFNSVCDWANLMWWCWSVHQKMLGAVIPKQPGTPFMQVIGAALGIAMSHTNSNLRANGSSWSRCKQALTSLRIAFGQIDAEWLKGEDGFDQCK